LPYKLFVDINMNAKTVTYWMGTDTRNQATTTPATITDNQVTWAQTWGMGSADSPGSRHRHPEHNRSAGEPWFVELCENFEGVLAFTRRRRRS